MSRAFNIFAAILVLSLGVLVYRAKIEAQRDLERLETLEAAVEEERRALTVLRAEIAYLEDPERLRVLAFRHLGLAPVDPLRIVSLEEAPVLFEAGRAAFGPPDGWIPAAQAQSEGRTGKGAAVTPEPRP